MRRLKYDMKLAAKRSKREIHEEIRNVIVWETTNLTKVQLFLQLWYLLLTFFHVFVLYKKKKKKSKLQMKYYFNVTLTLNGFLRTNGTRVNA